MTLVACSGFEGEIVSSDFPSTQRKLDFTGAAFTRVAALRGPGFGAAQLEGWGYYRYTGPAFSSTGWLNGDVKLDSVIDSEWAVWLTGNVGDLNVTYAIGAIFLSATWKFKLWKVDYSDPVNPSYTELDAATAEYFIADVVRFQIRVGASSPWPIEIWVDGAGSADIDYAGTTDIGGASAGITANSREITAGKEADDLIVVHDNWMHNDELGSAETTKLSTDYVVVGHQLWADVPPHGWSAGGDPKHARIDNFNDTDITGGIDGPGEQRFDVADLKDAGASPKFVAIFESGMGAGWLEGALICADDGTAESVTKEWFEAASAIGGGILLPQAPTARAWTKALFQSLQITLETVQSLSIGQVVVEVVGTGLSTAPDPTPAGGNSDGTSICPPQPVFQTVAALIESILPLSMTRADPIESMLGVTPQMAVNPIESLRAIPVTAVHPLEWRSVVASVSSTALIPIESVLPLLSTGVHGVESILPLSVTRAKLFESLSKTELETTHLLESMVQVAASNVTPIESILLISATKASLVEIMALVGKSALSPIEFMYRLISSRQAVIESLTLALATGLHLIEATSPLTAVSSTVPVPIESLGLISKADPLLLEAIAMTSALRAPSIESLLTLFATNDSIVEYLRTIQLSRQLQMEAILNIAITRGLPMETALVMIAALSIMPIEIGIISIELGEVLGTTVPQTPSDISPTDVRPVGDVAIVDTPPTGDVAVSDDTVAGGESTPSESKLTSDEAAPSETRPSQGDASISESEVTEDEQKLSETVPEAESSVLDSKPTSGETEVTDEKEMRGEASTSDDKEGSGEAVGGTP